EMLSATPIHRKEASMSTAHNVVPFPNTIGPLLSSGWRESLAQLLTGAVDAIESDVSAAKHCLERAAALLQGVPCTFGAGTVSEAVPTGGLAPWQAKRVSRYIEERLSSRIRVEELAAIARLSTSHFFHAFKETFATAPLAYVMQQRIRRAQQRMLTT